MKMVLSFRRKCANPAIMVSCLYSLAFVTLSINDVVVDNISFLVDMENS